MAWACLSVDGVTFWNTQRAQAIHAARKSELHDDVTATGAKRKVVSSGAIPSQQCIPIVAQRRKRYAKESLPFQFKL